MLTQIQLGDNPIGRGCEIWPNGRANQKLSGIRVLVVEDEAIIAFLIEELLKDFGCAVVGIAGSLRRGLTVVEDRSIAIDGAILDVSLGSEMSYPVASRLSDRGVPFLFCTAFGHTGVAPHFAHVPVLIKPFLPGDLEQLLVSTFVKGWV